MVGAGSAGAVIAARLSEDPNCRVVLLEAGERPPPEELMPAASMRLLRNPATDWAYTADAGKCGLGLAEGRMLLPRGKMLGGSSGINSLAYVRGHPGDYDAWAAAGAAGWNFREVLPYFKKSECVQPSAEISIDPLAHGNAGPLGVALRAPIIAGAAEFVQAAQSAGIPRGDYTGSHRLAPAGVVLATSSTPSCASETSRACAWPTPASCRTSSVATPTQLPS